MNTVAMGEGNCSSNSVEFQSCLYHSLNEWEAKWISLHVFTIFLFAFYVKYRFINIPTAVFGNCRRQLELWMLWCRPNVDYQALIGTRVFWFLENLEVHDMYMQCLLWSELVSITNLKLRWLAFQKMNLVDASFVLFHYKLHFVI